MSSFVETRLLTERNRSVVEWLIPTVLCAIFCGELFFSGRQLSQTADEAIHIYSGYRYLKCGDLTVSPEHPPFAKIVAAAPLLPMNLAVDCSLDAGSGAELALASAEWLYSQAWQPVLARARIAVSVFAVGLCVLVWVAARRMFDLATAIVAMVLLIFEPNVLAFGPLVLTDVPVTCMLLFAVYAFYLWVKNRTSQHLLLTALATGLTLVSKHSGTVVIPLLCVLAVADAFLHEASREGVLQIVFRNLLAVALICALAFGFVWSVYGMHFAAHPGAAQLQEAQPVATSVSARALLALKKYHVLPEAYLEGFSWVLSIVSKPGPAHHTPDFVAGTIYLDPPWFGTLLNLLMRSTTAFMVMVLGSAFGVVLAFRQRRRELLFVLIPAAIFLAICVHAGPNIGVRYLLPMFPFLLIAAAAGSVELGQRVRRLRYAVPVLLVLHAASSLLAYPNYLSYANELWGGPAEAYKYQGWLDLGQAYPQARVYLQGHRVEDCWFITGWQWDPRLYGIPCQTFGIYLPNQVPPQVHGTVIVSSTLLTDVRLPEGELAVPFKNLKPKDKIGGSALLVYEGDFDTRPLASGSERDLMKLAILNRQFSVALQHGQRGIELAPESALAHGDLCMLLSNTGQLDSALNECCRAQSLLQHDPLREDPFRKKLLDLLETRVTLLRTQSRTIYGHDLDVSRAAGADPR